MSCSTYDPGHFESYIVRIVPVVYEIFMPEYCKFVCLWPPGAQTIQYLGKPFYTCPLIFCALPILVLIIIVCLVVLAVFV